MGEPAEPAAETRVPPPRLRRAVLVEADPEVARRISAGLGRLGWSVEVTDRAERVLDLLAAGGFDLLLASVEDPDGSSLQVIREARGRGIAPVTVVYGGSARLQDVRREASVAGADALRSTSALTQRLPEVLRSVLPDGAGEGEECGPRRHGAGASRTSAAAEGAAAAAPEDGTGEAGKDAAEEGPADRGGVDCGEAAGGSAEDGGASGGPRSQMRERLRRATSDFAFDALIGGVSPRAEEASPRDPSDEDLRIPTLQTHRSRDREPGPSPGLGERPDPDFPRGLGEPLHSARSRGLGEPPDSDLSPGAGVGEGSSTSGGVVEGAPVRRGAPPLRGAEPPDALSGAAPASDEAPAALHPPGVPPWPGSAVRPPHHASAALHRPPPASSGGRRAENPWLLGEAPYVLKQAAAAFPWVLLGLGLGASLGGLLEVHGSFRLHRTPLSVLVNAGTTPPHVPSAAPSQSARPRTSRTEPSGPKTTGGARARGSPRAAAREPGPTGRGAAAGKRKPTVMEARHLRLVHLSVAALLLLIACSLAHSLWSIVSNGRDYASHRVVAAIVALALGAGMLLSMLWIEEFRLRAWLRTPAGRAKPRAGQGQASAGPTGASIPWVSLERSRPVSAASEVSPGQRT